MAEEMVEISRNCIRRIEKIEQDTFGPQSEKSMKLQHVFSRLDRLAMCVNGKIAKEMCPDMNRWVSHHSDYVNEKVTDERIRQIVAGEAKPKSATVLKRILKECPRATIVKLYSFDMKKMEKVRDNARDEYEERSEKLRAKIARDKEKYNTLTGVVEANRDLIKDALSMDILKLSDMPNILASFEITSGGIRGEIEVPNGVLN